MRKLHNDIRARDETVGELLGAHHSQDLRLKSLDARITKMEQRDAELEVLIRKHEAANEQLLEDNMQRVSTTQGVFTQGLPRVE